MHEHMHITDDRSNTCWINRGKWDRNRSKETGLLTLNEQILLVLFRRLSNANQDRVLRCAEVLSKVPDE